MFNRLKMVKYWQFLMVKVYICSLASRHGLCDLWNRNTRKFRTSLVAQWLRLGAPNAGGQVQSLVRELDPTCMPQLRVHMPQLRSQ